MLLVHEKCCWTKGNGCVAWVYRFILFLLHVMMGDSGDEHEGDSIYGEVILVGPELSWYYYTNAQLC